MSDIPMWHTLLWTRLVLVRCGIVSMYLCPSSRDCLIIASMFRHSCPPNQAWAAYFARYNTSVAALTRDTPAARKALQALLRNHASATKLPPTSLVAGGESRTVSSLTADESGSALLLIVSRSAHLYADR